MSHPAVLLVISDRAARGERRDETEALLRPVLAEAGFDLAPARVVPDEADAIAAALTEAAATARLVLTTGGTGVGPRDVTPEATRRVLDLELPGLGEEMRRQSVETTIKALGSRALGGVRGRAVVLNLPGRPAGAVECFRAVAGALGHLIALRQGPVSDDAHTP
jgi:molybdenum cofactor synthesis domain-containing protein